MYYFKEPRRRKIIVVIRSRTGVALLIGVREMFAEVVFFLGGRGNGEWLHGLIFYDHRISDNCLKNAEQDMLMFHI